jgi:putative NADPH-quinone reductase
MKILILNGSPHLDGATSDMANAFAEGAREAGHEGVLGCGKRRNLYGQREAEQVQKEAAGTVSLRKITIEQSPLRKERISRKSCPETMSNL